MKNLEVKGGDTISKIDCEHMNGIYRDLVDLVGLEATLQIFSQYKGQQISFPVKLMSRDYVTELIQNEYDGSNIKTLAVKYNYSERWVRKIVSNK